MKKFYTLFIAVLVAVTAFAQGRKAPVARPFPLQLQHRSALAVKHMPRKVAHKVVRKDVSVAEAYVKVNSIPEDWAGEYLIVYEEEGLAMNGGLTDKLDAPSNTVSVTIENDEIMATEATDAISFTIAPIAITRADAYYSIQSRSGLYMGWNSTEKNGLDSSAETQYPNALSIDAKGNADIVSESGSFLRYNASQNQERFRYFKSSTYTNQQPVALYKKGGEHTKPVGGGDLVVLPEGLETEPYALQASGYISGDEDWEPEDMDLTVQVAFDGNDVYISGLSYWMPESFVKGTLQDGKYLIPNTYMGVDEDDYENYLIAYTWSEDGEDIEDAPYFVLDFDAETRVFTLAEDYLFAESDDPTASEGWFDYWYELTLTPGDAEVDEEVVLPEGVTPVEYVLQGTEMVVEEVYDDEEDYDDWDETEGDDDDEEDPDYISFEPYYTVTNVAFDADTVYIQGLCNYLPQAWVKGLRKGNTVTVPTGQYFGTYLYWGFFELPMYFVGYDGETGDLADVTFTIADDGKTLTAQQWIVCSGEKDDIDYYQILTEARLTKPEDIATTPEAPSVLDFEDYDEENEYGMVLIDVPLTDVSGNVLVPGKLTYALFVDEASEVSQYTFDSSLYYFLDKTVSEIPFSFDDDYDFSHSGTMIYVALDSPTQTYDRIGVQSIYRGGGEEHKTEISWFTIDRDGDAIHAVQGETAPKSGVVYNLAGQRVNKPAKGLYIIGNKKVLVK